MPNLTDYDPDCAEAAAELWSQLANHEGEDADAQIIICRAFKEYACEHDKRLTSDQWAQQYREACIKLGQWAEVLEFYATAENYRLNGYPDGERPIWADYGVKARDALGYSPNVEMTDGYRRPDAPNSPKIGRR